MLMKIHKAVEMRLMHSPIMRLTFNNDRMAVALANLSVLLKR